MYEAFDDPYCYAGTTVLINKLDIHDAERLEAFEEEITRERAAEPLPAGRLSVSHFQAVHRHLFQDVYRWAGRFRSVRIAREGSMFCYPEYIPGELRRVFGELRLAGYLRGRGPTQFAVDAAHFLAELNAIHAFRDGNGRTQLAMLAMVADRAGHPLDLERLDPAAFLSAMIKSFRQDERSLAEQLASVLREPS